MTICKIKWILTDDDHRPPLETRDEQVKIKMLATPFNFGTEWLGFSSADLSRPLICGAACT